MAAAGRDLYDSNMHPRPVRPAADLIGSRTAERSILSFNLFGESAELPDVVHVETIAARSSLHGWELQPHRHARLHQLLLLTRGGGQAHLEGRALPLRPRSLVNVPVGSVHAFRFEPDTQGWVVTLAAETFHEALAQATDLRRTLDRATVCRGGAAVTSLMARIAGEHDGRAYGRAQVLRGLCAALLGEVARRVSAVAAAAQQPAVDHPLLGRFEALVDAHYLAHWRVADYARTLAITPTHLSRVVRQATGRNASSLIDERLIREARRQLVYTHLQVATIAYALGFADPAHFSRVFTRAAGMSPRRFRQRLVDPATPSARR
jgi:AraC family transcriptional activator of pobA